MKLGPGENEAELPATQVAVDDLEVVDPDFGFAFGMARVEMWEAMIIEEHRDRDPKKRLIVGMDPSWRERRRSSFLDFSSSFVP
jgi:hypothetical protein